MSRVWSRSRWLGVLLCAGALVACGHRGSGVNPVSNACTGGGLANNPWAQAPGLGGTGQMAHEPGLGGTGVRVAEPGGLGGTGVVGVVTGFSSLCVNGLRVEAMPGTLVQSWSGVGTLSALQVGDLVGLVALPSEGGGLTARQLVVLDRLAGPVEEVDRERGQLRVMGVPVQVADTGDLVSVRPGDWVRVAAQDSTSGTLASRVQVVPAGVAMVRGVLSPVGGRWQVGSVPLNAKPRAGESGQEVMVRGGWVNGVLQVSDVRLHPTTSVVQGAQRVVLQGFVRTTRSSGLDLGYTSVDWAQGVESVGGRLTDLVPGQLVVVSGRWASDQRVLADRIEWSRAGGRGATASEDNPGKSRSGDSGASGGDGGGQGRGRGRGRGRGGD